MSELSQTYAAIPRNSIDSGPADVNVMNKKLSFLRKETETMKSEIEKVNKRIKSLDTLYNEYKETINEQINKGELAMRVQNIEADVVAMVDLHDQFQKNLADTLKEREEIQETVRVFSEAFAELEKVKNTMESTKNGFDELRDRLEPKIPQVDENTANIDAMNNKIDDNIEETKRILRGELEEMRRQHDDDIKALRKELMAVISQTKTQTLDELQTTIDQSNSVDQKIANLDQTLRKHIGKGLKKYKTDQDNLRTEAINEVKNEHQELAIKHDQLRTEFDDLTNVRVDIKEMKKNIASNENNIKEIKDDIKKVVKRQLSDHQNMLEDHASQLEQIHIFDDNIKNKEIPNLQDQINIINTDTEEYRHNNDNRESNIENSVRVLSESTTQRFKDSAEVHQNFESYVKKEFAQNQKSHDAFQEHFGVLDTHVETQDQSLENMSEDNVKFKQDLKEFFADFTDKSEQRIKDIELNADAAKRTTASRCNDLETEINKAKRELAGIKSEVDEKIKKYQNDSEQMKIQNRADNQSFRNEMQRVIVDIREQSDASKQDIKKWNDEQFIQMKNKLKKMSTLLKSLRGADGTDLESLMNKINETDNDLRTNLSNAIVEQEKIKKDLHSAISKMDTDLSNMSEKIGTDFSSYQKKNDASISDNVHDLQTQINNLRADSDRLNQESSSLIDKNKTDINTNINKLSEKIEGMINKHKESDDTIASLISKMNDEIDITKSEVKTVANSLESSQIETEEREKQISMQIQKYLVRLHDKSKKNNKKYGQEFKEIQNQLKTANDKFTQSKLAEENLRHSLDEVDSLTKQMIKSLSGKIDDSEDKTNKLVDSKFIDVLSKIDKIQALFDLIKGDTDIDFPKLLRTLTDLQRELEDKSQDFNAKITNVHDKLLQEIHNVSLNGTAESSNIRQTIEVLRSDTTEILTKTISDLRERVKTTTDQIHGNVTEITNQFKEFIGAETTPYPRLVLLMNSLRDDLEESKTSLLETSRNQDNILQEQISTLDTKLSQQADTIETAFKSSKTKSDTEFNKVRETIKTNIQQLKDSIIKVNNELNRVSDSGNLTLPLLKAKIEELESNIINQFTQSQESIKEFFDKNREQHKKILKEISSIRDGAENVSLKSLHEQVVANENEINHLKQEQQAYCDTTNNNFNEHSLKIETKITEMEETIKGFDNKFTTQIDDVKTTAITTEDSNQRQFTDILQKLKLQSKQYETDDKKRKKEIVDMIKSSNENQHKENENILERQNQFEKKLEETEKKHDNDLNIINEKLIEKIGQSQSIVTKNFDDKTDILRDMIQKIEKEVHENKNTSDQTINAIDAFYNDELKNVKIDITKIKGSSDESLATISQSLKKFRESSETRFKTLEDQNISTTKTINTKVSEINNAIFAGDKQIQTDLDKLIVNFQNLQKNMTDEIETTKKDVSDKASKMEHIFKNSEATTNEKIDTIKLHLETSINSIESNALSQFESISNSLTELTKTVNRNYTRSENLITESSNQINEYFKNDNASIRKTISDSTETINKKISKVIDSCQKKFTEIDSTTDEIEKVHANDFSAVKVLLEDCENRLNGLISETNKSLKEGDQNLSNRIDILNHGSDENRNCIKNLETKEKADFEKAQSDLLAFQTDNSATLDQMMDLTKQHMEKRKQEVKKMKVKIQLEFHQMKELIDESQKQIEKNALIAKDDIGKMANQIRKEIEDINSDQKKTNSGFSKSIQEISQDISNRVNKTFSEINDNISETNAKFDLIDESFRKHQTMMKQNQTETDENFARVDASIESAQKILRIEIDSEKQKLLEKHSRVVAQYENMVTTQSKSQSQIDAILIEINDLKRVHFYNSEMESFSIKFEEVLSYLEKNKETICNYIHNTFLDHSLISNKGNDELNEASIQLNSLKLVEMNIKNHSNDSSTKSEKVIKKLKNDTEIGILIRNELKSNSTVKILIPKSVRVVWNRTVQILPHQKVLISGEDQESSVIQMMGVETYGTGGMDTGSNSSSITVIDPSRCLIDGFGQLSIQNCRIEATLFKSSSGKNNSNVKIVREKEQIDLRALFIVRGWDAVGPSIVKLSSCVVNSDHSIVNVGGNAFAHVNLHTCRITNNNNNINNKNGDEKKKDEDDEADSNDDESCVIYPVTAESGVYPNGLGVIASDDVVLAGKGIKWQENQYLIVTENYEE